MAINHTNLAAASKGCPLCGSPILSMCMGCKGLFPVGKVHSCDNPGQNNSSILIEPAGNPFRGGPHEGRYWCVSCWILYWSEHPECLFDEGSRQYVAEEARRIVLERGGMEVLFQDGPNRAYLTDRGTVLLEIKPTENMMAEEYSPERFQTLIRALQAIDLKDVPGYQFSVKSA